MQTAAMLHGNVNAVLARESFQVKIKKEIAGFQVDGTGMWIYGRYPGMGASPDGIVFDPISDTKGVLKIKCHMPLKVIDPNYIQHEDAPIVLRLCCTARRCTDCFTLAICTARR